MSSIADLPLKPRLPLLGNDFYTLTTPQGLQNPRLIKASPSVAARLGLSIADLQADYALAILSGNTVLPHTQPLAQAYAGHQFGHFNPFLGDGRAVLLAEVQTSQGIEDLYLKGSGRTVYARTADGYTGLSECLKEFTMSEQLAALGIPTTCSLCVLAGDLQVYRQGQLEPAAVLVRVAPTHIRFGTFELYYFQRKPELIKRLADFVMQWHYPACLEQGNERYAYWFQAVVQKTAQLIAYWQVTGFTHGVMNTDNQSIIGITLDLGNSSFNPDFAPNYVSNTEDEKKRYAFAQQPIIGLWNCNILARALSSLISAQDLRQALLTYEPEYLRCYTAFNTTNIPTAE